MYKLFCFHINVYVCIYIYVHTCLNSYRLSLSSTKQPSLIHFRVPQYLSCFIHLSFSNYVSALYSSFSIPFSSRLVSSHPFSCFLFSSLFSSRLFSHNLIHQVYYQAKGGGKKRWDRINKIIMLLYSQGREHYRPSLATDKKATSRYEISTRAGATTIRMYNSSLPIYKLILSILYLCSYNYK